MRILVTGHKGYIGTVMVPVLLRAGHEVVGLDSDLFRECTFCPGIQGVPEVRVDLRDVQRAQLEGFDALIHLAALSNDPLRDRKSTSLNSSHGYISYAVFCLKKKNL